MRKIIIFFVFVLFFGLMSIDIYGRYSEERNIREINRMLREKDAELGAIIERLEQCLEYLNKLKENRINKEDYQLTSNIVNNLKLQNDMIEKIIDELQKNLKEFKKVE